MPKRALIILTVSPLSVCATTRNLLSAELPKVIQRSSLSEWSGSAPVIDNASKKTVLALEANPVFLDVAYCFFSVPDEIHVNNYIAFLRYRCVACNLPLTFELRGARQRVLLE